MRSLSYLFPELIHGKSQNIISLMHDLCLARQLEKPFASSDEEVAKAHPTGVLRVFYWETWQGCDRFVAIIRLGGMQLLTCTGFFSIKASHQCSCFPSLDLLSVHPSSLTSRLKSLFFVVAETQMSLGLTRCF